MSGKSQSPLALFSGNANRVLSERIADNLDSPLANLHLGKFSDGEIAVELPSSVRGNDVYIIQPTCQPSDHLMELLLMIDVIKRSSAKRITAVVPYFGYARQDRRPWSTRVPISARLVANMLTEAGASRILTVDLHSEQIQGFFNIPVDNLYSAPTFACKLKGLVERPLVVSPDVGGVMRARAFSKLLDANMAIVDKRRDKANESEVMNVIGDVADHDCVIIDDIVDTAGTLCQAAAALKQSGAKSVIACATHGVLSGEAYENIHNSELDRIYVSNSIPLNENKHTDKFEEICIASVIARTIQQIHTEDSVQSIYNQPS